MKQGPGFCLRDTWVECSLGFQAFPVARVIVHVLIVWGRETFEIG